EPPVWFPPAEIRRDEEAGRRTAACRCLGYGTRAPTPTRSEAWRVSLPWKRCLSSGLPPPFVPASFPFQQACDAPRHARCRPASEPAPEVGRCRRRGLVDGSRKTLGCQWVWQKGNG